VDDRSKAVRRKWWLNMRAVGATEFGVPEAPHVVDVLRQPLGPWQIGWRVRAAAIIPTGRSVSGALRTVSR
jgi:hypothetical protein